MKNSQLKSLKSHPHFAQAQDIAVRLQDQGYLTVFAGGCVRDSLLGRVPKDLDLATSAPPDKVEQTFARTLAVGKAFGTIVVIEGETHFEVTTFRADGPYLDGRHPSHVNFVDIVEDAKRRDFTVNALFYDPMKDEVLDFVEGQKDLASGRLRAVGRAADRFKEDRLRMLRAVRFVAQLGFELDEESKRAIHRDYKAIAAVSVERIFNEVRRLLEAKYLSQGLAVLLESRMHEVFWPELKSLPEIQQFPKFLNWENAFAAICWQAGVTDPSARLKAWKVSRESQRKISLQLSALKTLGESSRAERARIFGGEVYAEVTLLAAGLFGEKYVQRWIEEYLEVADRQGCLPKPLVTGEDLLRLGLPPGQQMGETLRRLFDAQLEGQLRSKEAALASLGHVPTAGS